MNCKTNSLNSSNQPQTQTASAPQNSFGCGIMDQASQQYPNNLTSAEYRELAVGSSIHPDLISLNYIHLQGDAPYSYLFISPDIPRKNAGRVTEGFLKRYSHVEAGGWWVSGLDPLFNWEPMEWGRFKSSDPRFNYDKQKGQQTKKLVKYESPPKTPNRVMYHRMSLGLWQLVSERYNVPMPEDIIVTDDGHAIGFWAWVKDHPQIPIILCEGEKKAAALLSRGFVAIGLPGIWGGRVGHKNCNETLHPDLVPMATGGRKFVILFDYETKLKTRWHIYQAIIRTGKTIQALKCDVEVACLPGPEKGIDDWIVALKNDLQVSRLVAALIEDAFSLSDYIQLQRPRHRGLSDKYQPNIIVNEQYISNKVRLPDKGLVVLWSDMGTGKTELLRLWREEHPNSRFLNNGHRVNLLKNLAERLETEMYTALDSGYLGKATALSITIDSLYKLETQANQYGCVFIDEACQYLVHLLHSKTCKKHRAEILGVLEYFVYNAQLVVLADAHMDDITVDFFRAMRPPQEVPFIIKNEFKNGGRQVYWYEGNDSTSLISQLCSLLMIGKKAMVVSDSKRFVKTLEQRMNLTIIDDKEDKDEHRLRVWAIHSENSGADENIAFIKDITNAVKNIDLLLASPSLGTGVDICGGEGEYHFDAVFGVFHAVSQTATECAQMMYRYRPNVPFHIWVAPRPPFGYKECNWSKIKEHLLYTNEVAAFLIRIDRETGRRGVEKDWALDAYVKIAANRHQSINNLRVDLRLLLQEMNNEIIPLGKESDKDERTRLLEAAKALDKEYYQGVANANNISATEYRSRSSRDYLQPEQILECEKFRIKDSYGMDVTEELVEKDYRGRLIKAIASLEAILAPPEGTITDERTGREFPAPPKIVSDREKQERDNLPICTDWGNYSARWLALYNLGLHDILKNLTREFRATDPDLIKMTEIAIKCAAHVKAILGFTVPRDCNPIWLLGMLLNQLGLKLKEKCREGGRGEQLAVYVLSRPELEFAFAVIAHRERKRQEREEASRHRQEEMSRYAARMQAQYGIEPPPDPVVTPPQTGFPEQVKGGVTTDSSGNGTQRKDKTIPEPPKQVQELEAGSNAQTPKGETAQNAPASRADLVVGSLVKRNEWMSLYIICAISGLIAVLQNLLKSTKVWPAIVSPE